MTVALPNKRGIGSSGLVAVAQRLGQLEWIRARSDHQRRKGVTQIVESETHEIGAAARFRTSRGSLDRLSDHIGAEVVRVPRVVRSR